MATLTDLPLHQAELNLSYTLVTAPVSGIAGRIARSEGSLVTAGQDSSLLTTMNQVDPIWIRFSLSESDLAKLPGKRFDRIKSAEVLIFVDINGGGKARGGEGFIPASIIEGLDHKLVIIHDATVNRTTPARGRVSRYTAAELSSAMLGMPFTAIIVG